MVERVRARCVEVPCVSILLIGEGNATFASALSELLEMSELHLVGCVRIVATCFEPAHQSKVQRATIYAVEGRPEGGGVMFDVDATKVDLHSGDGEHALGDFLLFPPLIVIWNFPALLLDRAYGSHVKHRQLLLDFLKNMRKNVDTKPEWICPLAVWALPLRLEIWLTLHGRQAAHDQWQLDRQCEAAGMVIKETHPFRVDDFPGYQRSFQPMNDVGSTTFVIVPRDCHAPPPVCCGTKRPLSST